MTNALWEYYREAIQLLPEVMGEYAPVTTAGAAQTVTALSLAFGGNTEQQYAQRWAWRPLATTTTDREKQIDSWVPSTGVFTHSGSAYVDQTATDETLLITPAAFSVRMIRRVCNRVVQEIREWDETIVPARRLSNGEYHLSDLSWLQDAASIREIRWRNSQILSRNRDFDKWHAVNTSGVLSPPDFWTLAGAGATAVRGTTNLYDGPYVATLTRSGADATLLQTVGILPTGVPSDSLRGRTVTAALICRAADAAVLDVVIVENGTVTANSAEHTGGSTYETLTCSATIADTTDTLTFGARLVTSNVAVNLARCFLVDGSSVSDSDYRDDRWDGVLTDYSFEQGGPLKLKAPNIGFPAQFLICSERAFPAFDATRLASGAADTDESDAPLVPVATGIIAHLLEVVRHPDAKEWRRKYDGLRLKHMALKTEPKGGMKMLNPPITHAARRIR